MKNEANMTNAEANRLIDEAEHLKIAEVLFGHLDNEELDRLIHTAKLYRDGMISENMYRAVIMATCLQGSK